MRFRSALSTAIAVVVLVSVAGVQPADAVTISRNTTFKIAAKVSKTIVETGAPFVLSGTITPNKKGIVVRRDRLSDGRWIRGATTQTDKKGQWKFAQTAPGVAGTVKFRFVTPSFKKTSPVIKTVRVVVPPDPVITVRPVATDMPAGSMISLLGAYSDVGDSISVSVQQLIADVWTPIAAEATVGTRGWAARITLPMEAGSYSYQAVATTARGVATSPVITVNVLPPVANAIDARGPGTPSRIWGMDISRWQHTKDTNADGVFDLLDDGPPIDFVKAYTNGMRFVFIKASDGFVDSNGSTLTDQLAAKYAEMDHAAAQTAGLYTGLYHFPAMPDAKSPSVLVNDARQEAIQAAARLVQLGGYTAMDLPYVLDVEHGDGGRGISRKANASAITLWVTTWVKEFKARTGRTPIIYTGPNFLENYFLPDPLWQTVPLWIAHYGCTNTTQSNGSVKCVTDTHTEAVAKLNSGRLPATGYDTVFHTDGLLQWHFWQYSSSAPAVRYGVNLGSKARLDVNVFNGTSEQFMALTQQLWQPMNVDDYKPVFTPVNVTAQYESAPADEPVTFIVSAHRIDNGSAALSGDLVIRNNGAKIPGVSVAPAGLGLWTVTLPPATTGTVWNLSVKFSDRWDFYVDTTIAVTITVGTIA